MGGEGTTPGGRALLKNSVRILVSLVDISIHPQGSPKPKGASVFSSKLKYKYVEVVMKREKEGIFLHYPRDPNEGTIGQVSRLSGFWRPLAQREADDCPYRNL